MSSNQPLSTICPTCGTRLAVNSTRCTVCGSELNHRSSTQQTKRKPIHGTRLPELTLSLPIAIGLLVIILLIGAGGLYLTLKGTGAILQATAIPSPTETYTITPTTTETLIPSETPTLTLEPPFEYEIQSGDTCYSIAAFFDVSANTIILNNGLNTTCTDLFVGQTIYVPRPTATPLPAPTMTLEPAEATRAACQTVPYTVQENDTLSSIATNYNIPMQAIKDWNGLSTDNVYLAQPLLIPLCMRAATPGPSPTSTPPPPYSAPSLLLPGNGAYFTLADVNITLQWAAVAALGENERYQVTVQDLTAELQTGVSRQLVDYATDTKYIIPVTFRPQDDFPHVMLWWIVVVRKTGTDDLGNPIWTVAGSAALPRVFTWSGLGGVSTPTP